jgi:Protein of unknown function (DUF2800)
MRRLYAQKQKMGYCMNFNTHSELSGKHAFLSPSNYHWINYNEQKLTARWYAASAAAHGTALHEYAHQAIRLRIKQPRSTKTIYAYINDAIGYKMTPEQPLYYSEHCFGTADAISFYKNKLRIHDLKTGMTKTSEHQLEVYAALFCLEYGISPFTIDIELRIYQNDDVYIFVPEPDIILNIMDTIIEFDRHIETLKEGFDVDYR